MASSKVQYLCCAASLGISRTAKYAAFLGILRALILNFLLCHPKIDFLRDCQDSSSLSFLGMTAAEASKIILNIVEFLGSPISVWRCIPRDFARLNPEFFTLPSQNRLFARWSSISESKTISFGWPQYPLPITHY